MSEAVQTILGNMMSNAFAAFASFLTDAGTWEVLGTLMCLYIGWGFFASLVSITKSLVENSFAQ